MTNMVIEYSDDAYESFQGAVDAMHGYGVTITLDGETFDAVLVGADHDAEDGATIQFIRVKDDWYVISAYPAEAIESAVVERITVS